MRNSVSKTKSTSIYQLKITLEHISPPIWRRVEVPGALPLSHLHRLIQTVMGWTDEHMHAFQVGNVSYGQLDEEFDDGMEDEDLVSLHQIAPAEKSRF